MEFLRGYLAQTGGTDVEQYEISVPSSKTEEYACLIHQIELRQETPTYVLAAHEWLQAGISSASLAGLADLPNYLDPRMIFQRRLIASEGIVVGPYGRNEEETFVKYFDPPILYAKSSIWLVTDRDAGQPSGKVAECLIGYTLEKVSREAFIEALVD